MTAIEVETVRALRFDDGSPVRAASAVAPFGDGWLVAQDDAAHAAWVRPGGVERVRVVPPVEGHDLFRARDMKHLKPDVEAACAVEVAGEPGVLLLGSGSAPARMRVAVVTGAQQPQVAVADLSPLYASIARAIGRSDEELNLEGACLVGSGLRWFARGNAGTGTASAWVDVDAAQLVSVVLSGTGTVPVVRSTGSVDLGRAEGVGLEVTDAVALPDGRILVSASAEDTPNAVDDGPVVASALALLDGDRVLEVALLPEVAGRVHKVEGLALLGHGADVTRVLAVVDDDDEAAPSTELVLRVRWG